MDTADGPVRFRIVAGSSHSWATVLLESEPGALFVYRLPTGELQLIPSDEADRLIAARAYRPWRGVTEWSTLRDLPISSVGHREQMSPARVPTSGEPLGLEGE